MSMLRQMFIASAAGSIACPAWLDKVGYSCGYGIGNGVFCDIDCAERARCCMAWLRPDDYLCLWE
jgi:hypothetical protein